MIKTSRIAWAAAAAALLLSTTASAGGFATWPSLKHPGTRSWAYWGPGGAKFGNWYPGKYASRYGYYAPRDRYRGGCRDCYPRYYYDDRRYYDDDDDAEKLLWYGLGVATPLLLRSLSEPGYHYNY
jgi:hypothetical protein